jgi:ATP-binding cassette subfamily F protein 3
VAREEDLARERELAERQEAFVAKTEDFIRKNIAGQKTKQAQSRRKMLDKLDTVDRPEDIWAVAEKVRFRFAEAPRTGDIVLDARGLGAERGGRTLFDGVDLLVRRGERHRHRGPNGAGKSTLSSCSRAAVSPKIAGEVRRGTNLREGYFDQHLGSLDPARSAIEEIRSVRGDMNEDATRQYLARFRFYGDDPFRRVEGFSGGERARLALAKLLLEPRNLIFLDEPTNHLDIPAAEILEEALAGFEGTVVLVSHDRRFLEAVTTRTVHLEGGVVDVYPGGYGDWVAARKRRQIQEEADARAAAEEEAPSPSSPSAREKRVRRSVSTRPPRRCPRCPSPRKTNAARSRPKNPPRGPSNANKSA